MCALRSTLLNPEIIDSQDIFLGLGLALKQQLCGFAPLCEFSSGSILPEKKHCPCDLR